MDIPVVLDYALIVFITIAIINRIKVEAPGLRDFWYTLMSVAVGAGLYAVALYAPDVVRGFIYIGGAASGIFDVTKKPVL